MSWDYIKSQTYDRLYPEFTALTLFPVTHEVPEGAETVTYYSYDKSGMAKIISNYATDLPRVDVKGEPTTVPVKSIGDSYGYSVQEMRASRMAGKSLDVRKAETARYQIDRLTNIIAWKGDATAKLPASWTRTTTSPCSPSRRTPAAAPPGQTRTPMRSWRMSAPCFSR